MRIEELLFMFTKNIDLKEDYMRGGLKTNSGKNRVIPIHHLIKPIIKKHYNSKRVFVHWTAVKGYHTLNIVLCLTIIWQN